jgi:hypothetical protein
LVLPTSASVCAPWVTTTLANPASAESLAKRAQCAARDPAHVAGDRLSIGAGRRAGILVDDRRRAPQAAGSGVGFTLLLSSINRKTRNPTAAIGTTTMTMKKVVRRLRKLIWRARHEVIGRFHDPPKSRVSAPDRLGARTLGAATLRPSARHLRRCPGL